VQRSADEYCEPKLSYARALTRTMHVLIWDVRFPAYGSAAVLTAGGNG
jgi:hypothetical protein